MGVTGTKPPNYVYTGSGMTPAIFPEEAGTDSKRLQAGTYAAGTVVGQLTTITGANHVQTITVTGTPTGGTVRYAFDGQVTAAIAFDAAAAAVQAAFEALSNIGTGNVTVTGGPGPGTPWVLTFGGAMAAVPLPSITLYANSLTGGTNPTSTIAQTTPGRYAGGTWGPYDDAASDGRQVAKGVLRYATVVDTYGWHTSGGGRWGSRELSAPIFVKGYFKTADMTGIDANGANDMGKFETGGTTTMSDAGTILRIGV